MVEQALGPIVGAIAAQAPNGWSQAVLHSRAGRGGSSVAGGYTVRGEYRNTGMPNPYRELMALGEALRVDRGWDPVSLEIRCRPSGEYRLVVFHGAVTWVTGAGSGFHVVLDGDYRLPQPGRRQQPGTAAPAGDPELAVARFRAYLQRRAEILGHPEELPPPATPAAIDEAERRLGRRLPADLRALYLIADGDGVDYDDCYLFQGNAWLSLESMVAEHSDWSGGDRPWYGWDLEWDSVVFDTTPADTVRRCGAHPGWLRFATGHDGNFLAVDTDPARDGRPGQIIHTGRDYDEGPVYVEDSITTLLGRYLELLDQGAYEKDGDYLRLLPPTHDPAPQRIIGEIPDEVPPTLQAIHVNDATGLVDLAPLTAATDLRLLHLNRSTTADLAPVRALPVESLRLTLTEGDLTPLEGHPQLTALDLNTTAPVDLTPLRTTHQLRGLDLSGADVPDLTVLADLPDLRFLSLTARQWAALLDEGKVPATLAAARLADAGATFDQALALAARLGLDTDDALRATGTLQTADGDGSR